MTAQEIDRLKREEKFLRLAKQKHIEIDGSPKFDYSLFIFKDSHTKGKIISKKHGIFEQTPNGHLKSKGVNCHLGKTLDEFILDSNKIHENFYDYSLVNYINGKSIIHIICPIHGIFKQKASAHLQGQGCKKCAIEKQINLKINEYKISIFDKFKNVHNFKYDYSKYIYLKNKIKSIIICPEHGEFLMSPNSHLSGRGCPQCGKKNVSENKLYDALRKRFFSAQIIREANLEFLKNQRFDFYFPDFNIAIEYQGQQHFKAYDYFGGDKSFERIKKADEKKRILAKVNNCILLYFAYDISCIPNDYSLKIFSNEKKIIIEIENIMIKKILNNEVSRKKI